MYLCGRNGKICQYPASDDASGERVSGQSFGRSFFVYINLCTIMLLTPLRYTLGTHSIAVRCIIGTIGHIREEKQFFIQ